jgi:uncharacterized protein YggE
VNDGETNIEVMGEAYEDVSAIGATLSLVVRGSKLFAGDAALEKAKEVRQIVEALVEAGVDEDDVRLESVHVDVATGLLGRSSQATYGVSVRCDDVDLVPEVLEVVSDAKQCTLSGIEWRYDDEETERRIFGEAVKKCRAKAAAAADALECELGEAKLIRQAGMRATQHVHLHEHALAAGGAPAAQSLARKRSSVATSLEGMAMAPKRRVSVRVEAVFVAV